jgi:hypothetical protein
VIYFVQDVATLSIKIGVTVGDPRLRLADLQTGNPGALRLIGVIEGDESREAQLHRRFAAFHIRGEWFRPSRMLFGFIVDKDESGHSTDALGLDQYLVTRRGR